MYAITAVFHRRVGDWETTRTTPTFYLDENVQGILNEDHAKLVARRVLDPFFENALTITAVKV